MTPPAPNVARLLERIAARGPAPVLIEGPTAVTGAELESAVEAWGPKLARSGIAAGSICSFAGDFSCATVSLMLALMKAGAIAVPLGTRNTMEHDELLRVANARWIVDAKSGQVITRGQQESPPHPLVAGLCADRHPGLIVFTSGSTGKPKAILHDVDRVAGKFATPRRGWRMILFLLIDHFGGFNTLLACLADAGVGICVQGRSPEAVCRAVAGARAELLPTTPTFLGLLIASGLWRSYDLSSIRLITYGAEPMPESTLRRVREIFPSAELKQTYGLSELGVLRSASPEAGSLWLKLGGEGFETRVVDGVLHIRSASAMVGYLNAPSPIDADGWMNTGDLVEEKDGAVRFLGRKTEIINVGGQKVFPTEVESVLLEAPNVAEALVAGIAHPLLGQAVAAHVALVAPEEAKAAALRLRDHCRARLEKFKVPMRIQLVDVEMLASERSKKLRGSFARTSAPGTAAIQTDENEPGPMAG